MKRTILLIIILFAFSCKEDEPSGPQMGCVTGINKQDATNTIVYIKCITKEQYLAGNNTAAGGLFPEIVYYKNTSWKAINDCSKCSASWR